METGTSVYMCFPCYQEFSSLEEVLVHQLTCNPEVEKKEEFQVVPPSLQTEIHSEAQHDALLQKPSGSEGQEPDAVSVATSQPEQPVETDQDQGKAAAQASAGLIQYQCGDCGSLFGSLGLWQQHRKQGECQGTGSEPGGDGAEQNRAGEEAPTPEPAPGVGGGGGGGEVRMTGETELGEGPSQEEMGGDGDTPGEGKMGAKVERAGAEGGDEDGAVSQDHTYLPCTGETEEGGGGAEGVAEKQGDPAGDGVAAPPMASGTESKDVVEDPSPRRRGGRKGKSGAPSAASPSLLCVDCGAAFALVPELVAHRRAKHGLEGALHRCLICGESFLNTTLFLYHRKQHRKREGQQGEATGQEGAPERGPKEAPEGQNGDVEMPVNSVTDDSQLPGSGEVTAVAGAVGKQPAPDGESKTMSSQTPETETDDNKEQKQEETEPGEADHNFLCVDCGSGFATEPELVEHRKTSHDLKEAPHHCPECGEGFMNTTLFLYHRREHKAGERRLREGTGPPTSPVREDRSSSAHTPLSAAPKRKSGPGIHLLRKKAKVVNGEGESGSQREDVMAPAEPPSQGDPPTDGLPPPARLSRDWSRTPLPHACPHCGRTFTRRCLLRAHVFTHTGEKLFSCKLCGKSFSRPSNLMRHCRTHSFPGGANRAYPCLRCGKAFSQPASLQRHQAIHSQADAAQLPYACPHCPSGFHTQPELEEHRRTHTVRLFSCPECGMSFKRRKQLDQHSLVHQAEKDPKTCPICSIQFLNQSVLDNHMVHCSGKEDRSRGRGRGQGRGRSMGQLECDMCGHCCVTQEGLDLHRLSHTGQTPLRCPLAPCRRRFASSAALQEHVLAHCQGAAPKSQEAKPRPYQCQHCGKRFAYASTFKLHARIHTGERPYECSHCGKRFRQLPHLQDHERTHSGARPFCCWVCGKSFTVAARLTEHARTHSGEKPYACARCPRAFRSRSNLDKHGKVHERDPAPDPGPAHEGEAAVRTILVVHQAPGPESSTPAAAAAVYHGDPSSLVLLHPSVSVVGEQDVQHTIEFIIEETV